MTPRNNKDHHLTLGERADRDLPRRGKDRGITKVGKSGRGKRNVITEVGENRGLGRGGMCHFGPGGRREQGRKRLGEKHPPCR